MMMKDTMSWHLRSKNSFRDWLETCFTKSGAMVSYTVDIMTLELKAAFVVSFPASCMI